MFAFCFTHCLDTDYLRFAKGNEKVKSRLHLHQIFCMIKDLGASHTDSEKSLTASLSGNVLINCRGSKTYEATLRIYFKLF